MTRQAGGHWTTREVWQGDPSVVPDGEVESQTAGRLKQRVRGHKVQCEPSVLLTSAPRAHAALADIFPPGTTPLSE